MHVLDQKQSVLALPNFNINAKNWSKKWPFFRVDLKKDKETFFLNSFCLFSQNYLRVKKY